MLLGRFKLPAPKMRERLYVLSQLLERGVLLGLLALLTGDTRIRGKGEYRPSLHWRPLRCAPIAKSSGERAAGLPALLM